jgi:hypothetical protein
MYGDVKLNSSFEEFQAWKKRQDKSVFEDGI